MLCLLCPLQVLREFNQVADALSNQAVDEYRSGASRQIWTVEAAAAAAEAGGGGAAGLAAALHAADAKLQALQAAGEVAAAGAEEAAAAAVAAAEAEGSGSEGSGGGEAPAKRVRFDG